MAARGRDRRTREERERARAYQARVELHERQGRRRRRDNILGVVVGLVVVLGAIGVQTAYFTAGPGMPQPALSPTSTPDVPATGTPAPAPSESTAT